MTVPMGLMLIIVALLTVCLCAIALMAWIITKFNAVIAGTVKDVNAAIDAFEGHNSAVSKLAERVDEWSFKARELEKGVNAINRHVSQEFSEIAVAIGGATDKAADIAKRHFRLCEQLGYQEPDQAIAIRKSI